jgi:hypothetical protein
MIILHAFIKALLNFVLNCFNDRKLILNRICKFDFTSLYLIYLYQVHIQIGLILTNNT